MENQKQMGTKTSDLRTFVGVAKMLRILAEYPSAGDKFTESVFEASLASGAELAVQSFKEAQKTVKLSDAELLQFWATLKDSAEAELLNLLAKP